LAIPSKNSKVPGFAGFGPALCLYSAVFPPFKVPGLPLPVLFVLIPPLVQTSL